MGKQNRLASKVLKLLYVLLILLLITFGVYLFGFIPFLVEAAILIFIPLKIVKSKAKLSTLLKALILVLSLVVWLGVRIYIATENRRLQLEVLNNVSESINKQRENSNFGVSINLPQGWTKSEDNFSNANFEYQSSQIVFEKLINTPEAEYLSSEELFQGLKEQLSIPDLRFVNTGKVNIDGTPSTFIDTELTGIMEMKYIWTNKNGIVYNLAILISEEDKNTIDVDAILNSIRYE